jgi:DNA polymerase, archaea type
MNGQDGKSGGPAGPAVRIGITQVEYTADGAPLIHVFGRDPEGKAHHLQVANFRPYFYVPASQANSTAIPASVTIEEGKSYISIRGETLCRLYTQKPTDVRKYRESFSAYEADIPFTTRFMID